MNIKILGTGCPNCIALEGAVVRALKELKLEATIDKVTAVNDILSYGIMYTPGLVIDGEVKSSGRIPNSEQLKRLLLAARGE